MLVVLAGCVTVSPPAEQPAPAALPPAAPAPAEVVNGFHESDLPDTAEPLAEAIREPAAEPVREPRDGAAAGATLRARIVARARAFLGRRGPFQAAGERFNGDCSGFAQAVYAAEGIDLRGRMQRAAPRERGGARAAWLAARADGGVFGAEASPEPGDLVFWHDTYDRNRNGKADDPFTHVGIVEHVEDGTVTFLHRGGKGVAWGAMTLGRRRHARAPDGRRLNSVLRAPSHPVKSGGLASQLFAGYARVGDARVVVGDEAATSAAGEPAGVEPARAKPVRAKGRVAKPASTRTAGAKRAVAKHVAAKAPGAKRTPARPPATKAAGAKRTVAKPAGTRTTGAKRTPAKHAAKAAEARPSAAGRASAATDRRRATASPFGTEAEGLPPATGDPR